MGSITFLGQSADRQFKQWLGERPTGFYLNQQAKRIWMLHKSDCFHFGSGEGYDAAAISKVCSTTIEEIEKWAKDNNEKIVDCRDCKPR